MVDFLMWTHSGQSLRGDNIVSPSEIPLSVVVLGGPEPQILDDLLDDRVLAIWIERVLPAKLTKMGATWCFLRLILRS